MSIDSTSEFFGWVAIAVPLGTAFVAYFIRLPRWATIVASVVAAATAGAALYTRNIVSDRMKIEIALSQARTVLPSQQKILSAAISDRTGSVGFNTRMLDGEARDYAKAIADVFHPHTGRLNLSPETYSKTFRASSVWP